MESWWLYFNQGSKRWCAKKTPHAVPVHESLKPNEQTVQGYQTQFEVVRKSDADERIMELVRENASLKAQVANLTNAAHEAVIG